MTTKKKSPNIMLVVNLYLAAPSSYDQLYLSNYATIYIKDELARLDGVGDVTFLGPAGLQHAGVARPGRRWRPAI